VTKPGYVYPEQRDGETRNESQAESSKNQATEDEEGSSQGSIQNESVLAESSSPLLAYGVTNITFPANSLHSSHPITVRPASVDRRSQSFVQDSVSYAWEVNTRLFPGGGGVLSLYKGIGATKKIEIGRYQSDNGKIVPGGVLVIDAEEVDVLVAVMTLLSVLSQRDSFSFPTSRHAV